MTEGASLKPLFWVGSSNRDYVTLPADVQDIMGYALFLAQRGDKHEAGKPLQGFGGAGVLEIVSNHEGNTYRCVYTVRYPRAVYVLHAFQKKSKRGIETPRAEIEVIQSRLKWVQRVEEERK